MIFNGIVPVHRLSTGGKIDPKRPIIIPTRWLAILPALLSCLVFVLLGCLFISAGLGIQNDEALFASVIFPPLTTQQSISIFHRQVPLMLMSYLGTLKSGLYAVVFRFWRPSPASVRFPVLLVGTATVWLFYRLLRRVSGERAAVLGSVLLSTDTMFLLTAVFDWGPVALQHLLLVAGVLLLSARAGERVPNAGRISAGFFLLGLGLWDKALFVWMLLGLTAAVLVTYPRRLLQALSPRNLALAALSFALGALPLIIYNARHKLETFRANTAFSLSEGGKTAALLASLDGRALLGFLVRDDPADHPIPPPTKLGRASIWLSEFSRHPRSCLMRWGLLAAVLLTPLLWRTPARRPLLFGWVFLLVTWAQMVIGKNVGGSIHHVILMWPFPEFVMAIAFSEASRHVRGLGAVLVIIFVALLTSSNLLLANEYYSRTIQNGGTATWSDAIYSLSDFLKTAGANYVIITDWGAVDNLRLLGRGQLPLFQAIDLLSKAELTESEKNTLGAMLALPGALFIAHTPENEVFSGVGERLKRFATRHGYRQQLVRSIADRNGRTIFQALRFAPANSRG